jgi:hypothetical protein
MYNLLKLGAVIILGVVSVPVTRITMYCAVVDPILVPDELPIVFVKVIAPSPAKDNVPAMAISRYSVIP